MGFCFNLQGQATSAMGLSRLVTSTVHYLLVFAYFPIAPAELLPWNLSHLALKGLGWLLQISHVSSKIQFELYFLMYLDTIALQFLILLSGFYTPSTISGLRKVSLELPRGPFPLKGFSLARKEQRICLCLTDFMKSKHLLHSWNQSRMKQV